MEKQELLKVENLYVSIDTYAGEVQPIRGINFSINKYIATIFIVVKINGNTHSISNRSILKKDNKPNNTC